MKKLLRLLSFAFAVLLLLGTSGCKSNINTSPTFIFGTDAWRGYYTFETHMMTESTDSYYYMAENGYIHVIDKMTMFDTILCAKPNCLHDKRSISTEQQARECNGYVSPHYKQSVFYYDGFLYTVAWNTSNVAGIVPTLTQISLDGTNQKEIWKFDVKTTSETEIPFRYVFHRGVLYFALNTNKENGSHFFYAYNTADKKCTLLYESKTRLMELRMVGNAIYARLSKGLEDDLMRYDIASNEVSILTGATDILDLGKKTFIYYYYHDKTTKVSAHKFTTQNFDGTEIEPYTLELSGPYKWLQTDVTYLFITNSPGFDDDTVKVYDYQTRKLVEKIAIPENMLKDYYLMCSLDGKLFLYSRFGREEKGITLCYGEIEKIATGDFEWKPIERIEVEIDF